MNLRSQPKLKLPNRIGVTGPVQVGRLSWGRHGATRDRAIASAVEWLAARRFRSALFERV
jgi:hypothetical protein